MARHGPRRSRPLVTDWPDWRQPEDADILEFAHVLTPLVRFLHSDIVAAIAEDNRHHLQDWSSKLTEVGIDADIYLWRDSPCAFPGVRRHAGKKELSSYRDKGKVFPHCLSLDDNNYPKHLWAFVLTGERFQNRGPREYELAHLADHKEHQNRWSDEFSLDSQADPPPLFGLFTSPANTVYVPKKLRHLTDVVHPLRALLLKQAYRLYGRVCRLAPPPLVERARDESAWSPEDFTWSDPVGDFRNLASFLEYRQEEVNSWLRARLAILKTRSTTLDPAQETAT